MATLKDYYNTGYDTYNFVFGDRWFAQSFTASSSYTLHSIKLLIWRIGSPRDITISLRSVDGDGFPTGDDLVSATTDGNNLTTDSDGEWKEIIFASYSIVESTKYAIVFRCDGEDASNAVRFKDDLNGSYSGGKEIGSLNAGSSWSNPGIPTDAMFEVWAYAFTPPSDKIVYKRLVTAANNKFWYESI